MLAARRGKARKMVETSDLVMLGVGISGLVLIIFLIFKFTESDKVGSILFLMCK